MASYSGDDSDNTFVGSADADQADGNGGNDALIGLGGNDVLNGGDGDDAIDGGDDQDTLIGGAGADSLAGGNGDDRIYSYIVGPGSGPYTYSALSSDIYADRDTLTGGAGDDTLFAGYGDMVDGGANGTFGDRLNISFRASPVGVQADFRLLATQSSMTIGGGTITGIEYVENIEGSDFDDLLATFASGYYPNGSSIYGRGGNDTIIPGYYAGFSGAGIYGGDGDDLIDLRNAGYGPNTYGEAGDDRIIGGSSYERIEGGDGNDYIEGNYGFDYLYGGSGNDVIDGGSFGDSLYGGDGDDTLYGAGDADYVEGGAGNDLIYGDYSLIASGNALSPSSNDDRLFGGDGIDTIYGDGGNDVIDGGADADRLFGGTGNDSVTGGTGDDIIDLGEGDDTGYGGDGNDLFYSGTGNDQLSGEAGNDVFLFGASLTAADGVYGGSGADVLAIQGNYAGLVLAATTMVGVETLSLLTHSDDRFGGGGASAYSYDLTTVDANVAAGQTLKVNASTLEAGENLTFNGAAEKDGAFFIYGGKGVDTLTGGAGADVFFFAEEGRLAASDHVDGGAGADIMVLRGNYDLTLQGSSLSNVETVTLMSGADARFAPAGSTFTYRITTADNTVAAGQTMTFNGGGLGAGETLTFIGSAETDGAFRIFAGSGNDTLVGGAGADLLYGGLGVDTLTGGVGNDSFRYQGAAESTAAATDRITDFTLGDLLDLSRIDANSAADGDQAFSFIGSDAFTNQVGQLRAVQGEGGWTVFGDVNGDGTADFQLLVQTTDGHAITAADFIL